MARRNKALLEIEAMRKNIQAEFAATDATRQALAAQLDTLERLQARIVNEGFKPGAGRRNSKARSTVVKQFNETAKAAREVQGAIAREMAKSFVGTGTGVNPTPIPPTNLGAPDSD